MLQIISFQNDKLNRYFSVSDYNFDVSPARVVTVASSAHQIPGSLDVTDLHYKQRGYSAWGAYGQVMMMLTFIIHFNKLD
jgi:hypothetical protein